MKLKLRFVVIQRAWCKMDKFFKKQLYVWTYEKIKSNPKKFGGDECNSLLMQTYIYENYNIYLPQSALKAATTVSRIKSKLLLILETVLIAFNTL